MFVAAPASTVGKLRRSGMTLGTHDYHPPSRLIRLKDMLLLRPHPGGCYYKHGAPNGALPSRALQELNSQRSPSRLVACAQPTARFPMEVFVE